MVRVDNNTLYNNMFKKKPTLKPSANVKGSERKKVYSTLASTYSLPDNISEDGKLAVLPKTIKSARYATFQNDNGRLFTSETGVPLWFDLSHPNDPVGELVPSLYTLWSAAFLVPILITNGFVISKLCNGADLMIPGIFDESVPHDLPGGAIVGIANYLNPTVPLAIGYAEVDNLRNRVEANEGGVGIKIVHYVGDTLFEMVRGDKVIPEELNVITPLAENATEGPIPVVGNIESANKNIGDANAGTYDVSPASGDGDYENNNDSEEDDDSNEIERVTENFAQASINQTFELQTESKQNSDNELDDKDESIKLTTAEIDELFRKALLQTLHKAIASSIKTPLPASQFLSSYILPNLAISDPSVVLKNTSWKKATKFFKSMEKAGFVKVKEKGGEVIILSIAGKDNVTVAKFETYSVKKPATAVSSSNSSGSSMMNLFEFYRAKNSNNPLFDAGVYYTVQELSNTIQAYIAAHRDTVVNRVKPKEIIVDEVLAKTLSLGLGSRLGRDKINDAVLARFEKYHVLTKPGQTTVDRSHMKGVAKKGPVPKILANIETRMRGKVVTVISGLEPFKIDPVFLADELRVACAGSTTVTKGVKDEDIVTVQGPQEAAVRKALMKRGVREAWVVVNNRSKKGRK
ncbi:hypothetical protein NADFUDRAFT_51133 [Nadsonia fulvescens var. elongata DSM 6958]|uniref:SUI1 domain-containing protein n=1 Tax=Nadsonia fulvescens var. elongata DSM 6958 TaxID=857566 RepID=A0A1E3PKB3_9ASCO|nr:hypothetical protein NADFUDRAFT_51133 [Nadsonia fulvescens var. elongata DSM 6958]